MTKQIKSVRRAKHVRLHLKEISSRPRLSVTRSNAHIMVSLIDDTTQKTLATATDQKLKGTKTEKATAVGKAIAEATLKLSIKQVAYDRGSFRYHGRVKALAEAARAAGLDF